MMQIPFIVFRAIIIIVLLEMPVLAQSVIPDYELLAKQAILDHTINKDLEKWAPQVNFEENISQLKGLLQTADFRYRVIKLWNRGNLEAVAIVDETNIELHYSHTILYLIDKATQPCRYLRLDAYKMEDMISKYIIPKTQMNDSVRNAIIDLYNATALIYGNTYYESLTIIQSPTDSAFQVMRPFLDLKYIHKFYSDGSEVWQGRTYKLSHDDIYEYWRIIYFFGPMGFRTEKEIMLRGFEK